jgi:DNA ligase (NAD+)
MISIFFFIKIYILTLMKIPELLSISTHYLIRINNLKKEDIIPLREVIREHNQLYHILEQPIISDTEYDQLFHALARLESDHNMLDANSPTAQLAILASEQFQKVAHEYPMISLDNTYNMQEVREFEWRINRVLKEKRPPELWYYVQPKFDWLGLAVIYEYGKIKQAVTRWSGIEGEDVTLTSFEIENLPKNIEKLRGIKRMEVRGEVIMSRTEFNRINRERLEVWEKLFANPRNAASGSLRQLDPLITRSRKLQFFAYSIPSIEQWVDTNFSITTYSQMMGLLEDSWNFTREDFLFRDFNFHWLSLANVVRVLEQETNHRKEYFDFDIDGMVLKLDDMTLWDDLGRTEHHPRYAIAYKFPAKQVRTRVISIEHSVGRTGTVTPVANLEPVDVSGVIVRRATLHNYDELNRKWVREWDHVFIMRAGEVIPEIVSVITEVRDGSEQIIETPSVCPICSTPVGQEAGKIAIFCPNTHCPAKILGQLEMFVGKQAMNIDGLGPRQLEDFLERWWITDFASVYQLEKYRDQMLELDGYQEKSIQNLIDSLEKSRHTTLDRMFVWLNIPNVGKKTAKQLAKIHAQLMKENNITPLETLFTIIEEELLNVKDIWPETARAFVEYMQENRELVEWLYNELDIQYEVIQNTTKLLSELTGKSFCVTGSFDNMSRDQIHEMIESHGGEVRSSVSSKLDYLIAWENAGSKLAKANECGVQVLTISEFLQKTA